MWLQFRGAPTTQVIGCSYHNIGKPGIYNLTTKIAPNLETYKPPLDNQSKLLFDAERPNISHQKPDQDSKMVEMDMTQSTMKAINKVIKP